MELEKLSLRIPASFRIIVCGPPPGNLDDAVAALDALKRKGVV